MKNECRRLTKQSDRLSHDHRFRWELGEVRLFRTADFDCSSQFGHSQHYESAACTLGKAPSSGLTYDQAGTESALARLCLMAGAGAGSRTHYSPRSRFL